MDKRIKSDELINAEKELLLLREEKENRAAELIIANKELVFQNQEKENRAAELVIANKELVFQNQEKENRAAELIIANKELVFQNQEKENRAAELVIANKDLALQYEEKKIILESIDDAFFTVDKNWVVTYWNNQAEKILGRSKNEIAGKVLWEVYADAVDTPFYVFYYKAVEENKAQHFEAYYETLNIWLDVSAYPSLNGLSVYFRDVTERSGYIKTIEDQNKKLREIAFMQSHMVREPLARLMGLITLIQDPSIPNSDNGELLSHLLVSAHELDKIIRVVSDKTYFPNLK
ncbi:PAS domain-containing protein [Pedobacter sp. P351]|uniref:PAS domain-containing protein n=1 Tax=Pedobacter superstes TaxID=3133441 RepID=UPI0030A50BEF